MNTVPAVTPFQFHSHAIRTVLLDEQPWFVATDVCEALEYKNSRKAVADHLDDDERCNQPLHRGGTQTLISESGLYALVLRSRKPEARKFAKWVTSEVLPAIRKTGQYTATVSTTQQGELATLIAERFPQGRDRAYAWSRFNNHYRIASYKNLPVAKFAEACEYIANMPVKQEVLPKTDKPTFSLLQKRWLVYFDCNGVECAKLIPTEAAIIIPDEIQDLIGDPAAVSESQLMDILHAGTKRLKEISDHKRRLPK